MRCVLTLYVNLCSLIEHNSKGSHTTLPRSHLWQAKQLVVFGDGCKSDRLSCRYKALRLLNPAVGLFEHG